MKHKSFSPLTGANTLLCAVLRERWGKGVRVSVCDCSLNSQKDAVCKGLVNCKHYSPCVAPAGSPCSEEQYCT